MAAPATLSVFNILRDSTGAGIANLTVRCILNGNNVTVAATGDAVMALQQTTTTDAGGRYAFTVVGNDLLNPANTTYTIQEPGRQYDIAPQSTNGSPQQTTASNVIVNTPSPLAPAASNLTGPVTVTGTLTVTGLITGQAGITISGGSLTVSTGGITMVGPLTLTAAASQIVPGATSFSIRDTGNANDNLLVTNAGNATVRGSLTVTAGPLTVAAGGATITAGGLTVSAGGAAITGNSTVTGTLTVSAGLTVQAGGAVISAGGLTISGGGASITGNSTVTGTLTISSTVILTGAPGQIFMNQAGTAQIVGGTTGFAINNNANSAANASWTDAGLLTLRNALSIPPSAGGTLAATSYGTVPVKIGEVSLGAAAASVTFSSLPSGFRDLRLKYQARGDSAVKRVDLYATVNADVGSNYSYIQFYGNNAAVTMGAAVALATPSTGAFTGSMPGSTATANYPSAGEVIVPNYSGATFVKLVFGRSVEFDTIASADLWAFAARTVLWNNTAAMTSLSQSAGVGNIIAASLFTLYGEP